MAMNEFCGCGSGVIESSHCYNTIKMQELVRWSCPKCGKVTFTQAITIDANGCEHPIFMTRKQWFDYCRQFDYHYLALEIVK